jgi:hypothetical protein
VTDAARRFDRRLLHDDKPGTRQRQRTQVLEMPVVRRAVLGAVLAHRRHRDPIGKGDAAEAKWFEQGRYARHQNGPGELNSLIADDGAALVTYPEYHTPNTLTALQESVDSGGRLAYLGGNGFYWRIATSAEIPDVVEVRRAEGGIRAWAAEPGEYFQALDGGYGGLWRRNGRPPQILCGVGFSAQGLFEGSYYRRMPGAADPRAAWIFEGIDDEILGDFGLSRGGAAGFELDSADFELGTPPDALILARSEAIRAITSWCPRNC